MVYLVGAGPGDPGLITVKALDILRRADVVLYDSLIDSTLLCETRSECILIDVGKRACTHTKTQEETTHLLVEYGRKGFEVVRLKGGDPFLFGRGGEEAEHLSKEKIPFVIVPGVSALTSVPAYAGIPLTHRTYASSVGIATGHGAKVKAEDPVRWQHLSQGVDTLVVFMGVGTIHTIIDKLTDNLHHGDIPAAVIEQGTTPSQRIVIGTLSTIADKAHKEHISPPALLVVGNVVSLAGSLNWYKPGPLAGLRIGITRPLNQSKPFSDRLRDHGAHPISMPVIKTVETPDTPEVQQVIANITHYDWIVFSSINGVESFFRALKIRGCDVRKLASIKIACIGPVTAQAVKNHGILADITAQKFIAESLLDSILTANSVAGKSFLLVRSNIGRSTLMDELTEAKAMVDQAVFYSTQSVQLSDYLISLIKTGLIDIITFTSSSTVESFFNQMPPNELMKKTKLASIGPQTSLTLKKYNKHPDIEASEYTTSGLAEAILEYYRIT
ncbi:MAG TPA: uroporphyrinogen-III C-methyltransferase [Anaerolineae bacterium]|nr:uroporphyrinogen-III C-methyltransferase [Anaerolineae bacterium]